MIDDDDVGDAFLLAAISPSGGLALLFIAIACVFWIIANGNAEDCAKKTCPNGQGAELMHNECLCVMRPQ